MKTTLVITLASTSRRRGSEASLRRSISISFSPTPSRAPRSLFHFGKIIDGLNAPFELRTPAKLPASLG